MQADTATIRPTPEVQAELAQLESTLKTLENALDAMADKLACVDRLNNLSGRVAF